jgi:hypothetical protein
MSHLTIDGLRNNFVLGRGEVVIEVKGTSRIENRDLRPLIAFSDEHRPRTALFVCNESAERHVGGIRIVPWRTFLERLWAKKIIA